MNSFVYTPDVPEDLGFSTFFWHVYRRKKCTNVEFICQGPDEPVTFSAHKFILALWSVYFADLFFKDGSMAKDVNIIQLNDVNPQAFEDMLRFMYGYTPEFRTPRQTCELYRVAVKFKVMGLKKLCRQIINKIQVVPSNVFDIVEVSRYMENKRLTDRCLNLIQENTSEVLNAYALSEISSCMLHTILDLPKLSLPGEFDFLMWVFAWGKNKFIEDSEYRSTRDALAKFLPKMHFLSLTNAEFATLYNQQQTFFSKDEVVRIFMNIATPGLMKMPEWFDEERPSRAYTGSSKWNQGMDVKEWIKE